MVAMTSTGTRGPRCSPSRKICAHAHRGGHPFYGLVVVLTSSNLTIGLWSQYHIHFNEIHHPFIIIGFLEFESLETIDFVVPNTLRCNVSFGPLLTVFE